MKLKTKVAAKFTWPTNFILLVFSFVFFSCQILVEEKKETKRPNIIVILADDMGFSDLGCTGAEIETPNLDALANNGMLFTNCYNTSRCCPTRASLLTGLYQHQVGYGHMDSDRGFPAYQGRFRAGIVTLPQLLQEEGYRTIMLGKWHLGHEQEYGPLARGFDRMYGIPKGGGVYFYPCIGRDRQVFLNQEEVIPDSSWYSTDAFTDYGLRFIKEARQDQKPFFMYLAYIAPHFPLQARAEDIQKYKGKYSKGYAFYRNQRFEKQKRLGIIQTDTKLSKAEYDDWNLVENKTEEDLKMAVYAAQMDRMDQNIGRLVRLLEEQGILDNTLILFLSDNGGTNTALHAHPEAEIGSRNCWSAYGKSWANVSNTPYRKYKAMTHEGGIITPLIIHWPNGIETAGKISHEPVHITDISPSILALIGKNYPAKWEGKELPPLVGNNMLPLLEGGKLTEEKTMFFEHQGNQAVRIGDWKLVSRHKQDWELYHLGEDPTELVNLARQEPDKKAELLAAYQKWAIANEVMDWPISQ